MIVENILKGLGNFLTYRTAIEPADYIVVLNGSTFDRVREAIELYKDGYGKKILVPKSFSPCGYDEIKDLGINVLDPCEINVTVLRKCNIPEDDIKTTLDKSFGTREEAISVKNYLGGAESTSLILVTSHFHSRRAYKIFKKVLNGRNIKIMCQPTKYDHIDMNNWWKVGWQRKWILFEYLKLAYHSIRH
jgi:uncharacterized SAM-binding protein YcdF (DUF218 family)